MAPRGDETSQHLTVEELPSPSHLIQDGVGPSTTDHDLQASPLDACLDLTVRYEGERDLLLWFEAEGAEVVEVLLREERACSRKPDLLLVHQSDLGEYYGRGSCQQVHPDALEWGRLTSDGSLDRLEAAARDGVPAAIGELVRDVSGGIMLQHGLLHWEMRVKTQSEWGAP
jgi:hypothetical protein